MIFTLFWYPGLEPGILASFLGSNELIRIPVVDQIHRILLPLILGMVKVFSSDMLGDHRLPI